ncbi:MAG: fibronectin type III domain-containing protein [Bacteroidota bacterium]
MMRHTIFKAILCLFVLMGGTACNQETFQPNEEETVAYQPQLSSVRGEGTVWLRWGWFTTNLPTNPVRVSPDGFRIFFWENNTQTKNLLVEVDGQTTTYPVTQLENGKVYFFEVEALVDQGQSARSNTIVSSPGPEEQYQIAIPGLVDNHSWGSWHPDGQSVLFVIQPDTTDIFASPGSHMIYQYTWATEQFSSLVEGTKPSWSFDGNFLAFETDSLLNKHHADSKTYIQVYQPAIDQIGESWGGDGYYREVAWAPDRYEIAFLGTLENETVASIFTTAPGVTAGVSAPNAIPFTVNALDELEDGGDPSPARLTWENGGKEVVYDRLLKKNDLFVRDIFQLKVDGSREIALIASDWNDFGAAFSPDNQRMAFFSDRSGRNEIWLWDRNQAGLKQITGTLALGIRTDDSRLAFSPDGKKIMATQQLTEEVYRLVILDLP